MIIEDIGEVNSDIELLTPQSHENIAIIPLKTNRNYNLDILTLKKGLELNLVAVNECEKSTVNTLIVVNKAVTPLLLIDGEEVVGGDQNRLVNSTILIAPRKASEIPVSCTERGRWAYKSEFKQSDYLAAFNTRRVKSHAMHEDRSPQHDIWTSIDELEMRHDFSSPTSSMNENYENKKVNLNEILHSFEIVDGQNGVLIMINGEIKGFELFLNPEIYKEFHEKVLKSYLIDAEVKTTTFTINIDAAKQVIDDAMNSSFEPKQSKGLENAYGFENSQGIGDIYIYENEIIHWSYFKKEDSEEPITEITEDAELKLNI